MTDNEIIKALECCISPSTALACFKCPMVKNKECNGSNTNVNKLVVENALDLINSQKAEIERLQCSEKRNGRQIGSLIYHLEQAKSEAYREFCKERGIDYVENDV